MKTQRAQQQVADKTKNATASIISGSKQVNRNLSSSSFNPIALQGDQKPSDLTS